MKVATYFALSVGTIGNANGLLMGMPAIISSVPANLTVGMKCHDLKPGETREASERFGCWILANGNTFFGATDIYTDLSESMPRVKNKLYDNKGMADSVRSGCFTITSLNGDVSLDKYSFSSLAGYSRRVQESTKLAVSAKASYLLSSVSASYNSAQDSENKVNSRFSYAKAHIRSEIQLGKVKNNCMGTKMSSFITEGSRQLWEAVKENPDDIDLARSFNAHFRVLHPDEWIIGGIHKFELTSTISSTSTFNSESMSRGVAAAANVGFGAFSVGVSTSMERAFKTETSNSRMTTITQTSEAGAWPCEGASGLLKNFQNLTIEEYGRQKKLCQDEFENKFESWTPYKTSGYSSTLDIMMTPSDRLENPDLEDKLARALHDQNVKCNPVKIRGFRIIRNTSTPTKNYIYNLAGCDPICRFEQGSPSLVFERVSGTLQKKMYLVHNVTHPAYNNTAYLALTVYVDGRIVALPRNLKNPYQTMFGYNETNQAFTFTLRNGTPPIQTFPLPEYYKDETGLPGWQFFLDSDAHFIGTNSTQKDDIHQKTFLLHVNGVRSSMDGKEIELCEPEASSVESSSENHPTN
mmetsp:Transcript_43663/g.69845  ORF Transcript_43663/g.69845 Transcript_43663/m.69845 type:complete len:581 (-) Transcript_43663:19-1761(-)